MAEMVVSVLVQECLSKAISFVLGRREEKASQGIITERLEMAVSQLEFALERTAKLPVTELSLLHRRKMIKRAYLQATELLNKHKQLQALKEGQQEDIDQAQGANSKRSRWATILAKNNNFSSVSSFAGLKTDDVRRFEWFGDHAGKFVRDVESGCSLRHHTFCNPLVRYLLDGKTIRHQVLLQGSGRLRRRLYMQPLCLEGRGVETVLIYQYRDHCNRSTPDRSFNLVLILRLSESTDIVHTAIVCLQWMASQFKIPAEAAIGELTQLPDVQYTSHPHARCHAEIDQESYGDDTQYLRPDPVCCKQGNMHGPCANSVFPEEVIHFFFRCSSSALDCSSSLLLSSSSQDDEAAGKRRRAPMDLTIGCLPHHVYNHKEQQQLQQQESCYALEINGDDDQERGGASVAHGAETLRFKATCFFLQQPELTEYRMLWIYRHGVAGFFLEKRGIKRTETSRRSTSSRLAAACHRSMSVQQRRRSLKRERTDDRCHDNGHACPFGPWAV